MIKNYCKELFKTRHHKAPVTCNECGTKLTLFGKYNMTLCTTAAIDHARLHIGKIMFNCRHCDHKTVTRGGMRNHLFKAHGITTLNQQYKDLSCNHADAIKGALIRCFGQLDSANASLQIQGTDEK